MAFLQYNVNFFFYTSFKSVLERKLYSSFLWVIILNEVIDEKQKEEEGKLNLYSKEYHFLSAIEFVWSISRQVWKDMRAINFLLHM